MEINITNTLQKKIDKKRAQQKIDEHCKAGNTCCTDSEASIQTFKLFEHILIVGPPPDGESFDPKILFFAPATPIKPEIKIHYNVLIDHCFPNGLKEHEVEYYRDKMFLSQFVFYFNSLGLYGICCHLVINPRRIPFFASEKTVGYPFCFCFLTEKPILSVHFQYLTYLGLLFNRVVNPADRPPIIPSEEAIGDSIESLTVENNTARWPGTRFPELFVNEILFFKQTMPSPDRDSKILLAESNKKSIFLIIPHSSTDSVNISMVTFDVLFSCLSVNDIVNLYTELLLEHCIIFKSKDLQKVTLSVLAAHELTHPFCNDISFSPILPDSINYLTLLENPTPSVYGISSETSHPITATLKESCIIDLDNGTFKAAQILDENGEPLKEIAVPNKEKLILQLTQNLDEYKENITVPPKYTHANNGQKVLNPKFGEFFEQTCYYMRPPKYLMSIEQSSKYVFIPPLVDKIIQGFSQHLAPELDLRLRSFLITDSSNLAKPITILNESLFLESVDPNEKLFFKLFLGTQMFSDYLFEKTTEIEEKKKLCCSFVTNFDSM